MKKELIVSGGIIEQRIYLIRGQRVILDQDLAVLYGVSTGNFNKAINRNQRRFPNDFAFRLTRDEWTSLIFQFGISKPGRGGRRKLPIAFTEHGVAMAANLLKSERAINVSVEIVRTFIKLREFLSSQKEMTKEFAELKSFLLKHSHSSDREFKRIWQAIEKLSQPPSKEERQMGFELH